MKLNVTYKSFLHQTQTATSAETGGIELASDGNIIRRTDMYVGKILLEAGKYYRIRWTVANILGCKFISESFNVGYL